MIQVVCNDANPNIRLGNIGKDSKFVTWISTLKSLIGCWRFLHRTGKWGNDNLLMKTKTNR